MNCPYLKKYSTRFGCESPEGPLLNEFDSDHKRFCETHYLDCHYYREAQTDLSKLRQAIFSKK